MPRVPHCLYSDFFCFAQIRERDLGREAVYRLGITECCYRRPSAIASQNFDYLLIMHFDDCFTP